MQPAMVLSVKPYFAKVPASWSDYQPRNALRRLRLSNVKRLIWLDAVCIDQGDAGERNHQILWMSHIFSKAFRVIIYLGEANKSITTFFQFFTEVIPYG